MVLLLVNLPNMLTALRLVLAPAIAVAILYGRTMWAFVLFAIAGVTDVADGALARRLKLTSDLGARFDPVADKALMFCTFLALAIKHAAPWWFFALVVGRDVAILITATAFLKFTTVRTFSPSIWGKASTFAQIMLAGAWMLQDISRSPLLDPVAFVIFWISVSLTTWSWFHYSWLGYRALST